MLKRVVDQLKEQIKTITGMIAQWPEGEMQRQVLEKAKASMEKRLASKEKELAEGRDLPD
jgi:hypothetical protein